MEKKIKTKPETDLEVARVESETAITVGKTQARTGIAIALIGALS